MTVGFVVTPDEIKDRVASLDASIAVLDGDIRANTSPQIPKAWRAEWDAFVRRWTLERDSYASWGSRLFATRVMPRLDSYSAHYLDWARQYARKTGQRPPTASAKTPETLFEGVVPTQLWWAAGIALGLYLVLPTLMVRRGR
jgi:hypothetical protein